MAAFDYTQPVDATIEPISYAFRVNVSIIDLGVGVADAVGAGPIPFVTRYSPSGSVAFLYIQTDRVLVSSGSMTTTSNYILSGPSAPSITAVTFTTGKTFLRLTLSGPLTTGQSYFLFIKENTFSNGISSITNTIENTPIYLDA